MDVRVGLWRKLSTKKLMLLNCGVGEDSWESLGLQGDPTSHSEGDQLWDFFGRTDAKAETPVIWLPHAKSWLIGKDPDAGRDWGREEKGTTEDEMAGWHHWLDGRNSEWTPGVGDGQGGLVSCDSWGRKESDTTEWLNWTELKREYLGIRKWDIGKPDESLKYIFQVSLFLYQAVSEKYEGVLPALNSFTGKIYLLPKRNSLFILNLLYIIHKYWFINNWEIKIFKLYVFVFWYKFPKYC